MSTTMGRTTRAAAPGQAPTRQQLDELDALLQRMLDLPVVPGSEAEMPAAPPPPPRPAKPARTVASAPARPAAEPAPSVRPYPASYMVVETSAPPFLDAQPEPGLDPATLPMPSVEPPVPGGRHDLVEDVPADPVQELARRRLGQEGGDWVPFQSSWQPSAQTWGPLAETWRQSVPEDAPRKPDLPRPSAPTLADIPAPSDPALAPTRDGAVVVTEYPPSSAEMPAAAALPAPPVGQAPVVLWPLVAFNAVFDLTLLPLGPVGGWLKRPSGGGLLATAGMLCLAGAAALVLGELLGWSW